MDLNNLAYPNGCCRFQLLDKDGPFFKSFLQYVLPSVLAKKYTWHKRTAQKVTIEGMLNEREKNLIHNEHGFSASES